MFSSGQWACCQRRSAAAHGPKSKEPFVAADHKSSPLFLVSVKTLRRLGCARSQETTASCYAAMYLRRPEACEEAKTGVHLDMFTGPSTACCRSRSRLLRRPHWQDKRNEFRPIQEAAGCLLGNENLLCVMPASRQVFRLPDQLLLSFPSWA